MPVSGAGTLDGVARPLPPPSPHEVPELHDPLGAAPTSSARTPRPGQLTRGWSVVFGLGWLAVAVALAGVWSASRQLGLSTWWLGPSASPRPLVVSLVPFAPAILLIAATLDRRRHLAWWGLGGAAVIAAVGAADLARVRGLGIVELVVAGAAAALSLAALGGTYRAGPGRPAAR